MAVWLSTAEIMGLPASGPAWDAVASAAKSAWGSAKVNDQNSQHDVNCLAGALFAVRMGDAATKKKVGDNCLSAIGTEAGGRTLALGRNLAAYCAAADTVGFRDPAFVNWVKAVVRKNLDGMTLQQCQERRANNWGVMASMSRIAAALYTNDVPDLARATLVFQGWLGDRAKYAGFKYGDLSWQCDSSKPVGVNPACSRDGHALGGCLPDDQRRAGGYTWPPPAENYVRGSLGPAFVALEMLRRNGYPDAPTWSSSALKRASDFFVLQAKGAFSGDDGWMPFLIRKVYPGINCPGGSPSVKGKPWAWAGFTHG